MKKREGNEKDHELEILKAVAQAWHGASGNQRPMKEFDAQQRHKHHGTRPSRFKLEAMDVASKEVSSPAWDFAESLWDSYEIVTLSRSLESKLVMDHPLEGGPPYKPRKKRTESKKSLRTLFGRISSKRYDADALPPDYGPRTPDAS